MKSTSLSDSVDLFEVKPGKYVSLANLKAWLPDMKTALFFAKTYNLDYQKLSALLYKLFNSSVLDALMAGDHSLDLQDYLVDTVPEDVWPEEAPIFDENAEPPQGEILPELWELAEVTVAKSIQEVADKLAGTLALLPSKEGSMVFQTMAKLNRLRPTVGDYRATIQHQRVPNVAVVLDVSGSMTENTIRSIIEDVVALSWKANAHLLIVSNHTYHWEPGSYSVDDVLAKAEYGGTYYETLAPMFNQDWGTVITIADYDSSRDAQRYLAKCSGRIGKVLDISLVNKPTFLSECLGQLADEVQPLLVAQGLLSSWYGY